MNKEKFGKTFYYAMLIVAIIAMVIALLVVKSDGTDESANAASVIRYMVAYYSFATVLGSGTIVNEYCSGKFDMKKLKLKILVVVLMTVIGTPIFILTFHATIACALFFVSLLSLIYVVTPTIKDEKKNI